MRRQELMILSYHHIILWILNGRTVSKLDRQA